MLSPRYHLKDQDSLKSNLRANPINHGKSVLAWYKQLLFADFLIKYFNQVYQPRDSDLRVWVFLFWTLFTKFRAIKEMAVLVKQYLRLEDRNFLRRTWDNFNNNLAFPCNPLLIRKAFPTLIHVFQLHILILTMQIVMKETWIYNFWWGLHSKLVQSFGTKLLVIHFSLGLFQYRIPRSHRYLTRSLGAP